MEDKGEKQEYKAIRIHFTADIIEGTTAQLFIAVREINIFLYCKPGSLYMEKNFF